MRVFVSIELPDYIKKTCVNIQHQLKQRQLFSGNFVSLQHLHITLMFCADMSAAQLDSVKQVLNTFEFKGFEVTLGSVEVVSDRLIWISVSDKSLNVLYERLKDLLGEIASWEDHETVFKGHITLVRIKHVDNVHVLNSSVRDLNYIQASFRLDKICLKLSELTTEGSMHSIIECYMSK